MAEMTNTPSMPRSDGAMADTGSRTEQLADEAREQARQALATTAELGTEMLGAVRDHADAFFREQKARAAGEIGAVGDLLHRSVQLMQRKDSIAARYANEAASEITNFADRLRMRSWGELMTDIEGFARRYPLAFCGAAAGFGFVAARFLTASATTEPGSRSATRTWVEPRSPAAPSYNTMQTPDTPAGATGYRTGAIGEE